MLLVTANIFQPLIDVFESVLKFFHNSVGIPWGWSIVLLTICVRAVLVPLTVRQIRSMARMQQLAPEMKAIQAKYKEDKQRQQQEMMKFYKENNVNPLGSCLPLVAQLPVFISLYYMLRQSLRIDICPAVAERTTTHWSCSAAPHTVPCGSHGAELPVHPGPHQQGHRRGAGGPDHPLRRDAARLQPDDVRRDDGPHAAADHAVHAAAVRAVRDPLPGRRARLLDHHEPLDDGPAVRGQAPDRPRAPRRRDRGREPADRRQCGWRWALGRRRPTEVRPQRVRRVRRRPRRAHPEAEGAHAEKEPVATGARGGAPPKPPRKKKKRSGRRR